MMAFWPVLLSSPASRGWIGALFGLGLLGSAPAAAQNLPTRIVSPDGGTRILNQATVVYEDATGRERSVTTNEVALVVQSVYAGQIAMDQRKRASPLSQARFVHTLTNTGNTATDYCVSGLIHENLGANATRVRVYLDQNRNSLLDASDPLLYDSQSSASYGIASLARDAQASLILAADLGAALSSPPSGTAEMRLRAQVMHPQTGCSAGLVTADQAFAFDLVQDVVEVDGAAVLDLAKASEYQAGGAGLADDRIRYTLTLTNRGFASAHDALVIEELNWPMTYVAGSLTLDPPLAMTMVNSGAKGFVFRLTQPLAPSAVVKASFYVQTNLGAPPPPETLLPHTDPFQYLGGFDYTPIPWPTPPVAKPYPAQTNRARVQWLNDPLDSGSRRQTFSNRTQDYVESYRRLRLDDTGVSADLALNDGGDDDQTQNDVQFVDAIGQGRTVRFDLLAWSLGDDAERLQIALEPGGSFPPGTAFSLHRADAATRLTDENGDGWFDLGFTGPSASQRVVVLASLPMGAVGVGPYEAPVRLRLAAEPTRTDPAQLRLGAILPARLDIAVHEDAAFNDGGLADQDPKTAAAVLLTASPGDVLVQRLALANEGGADEDALLAVWLDAALTIPAPAAWQAHLSVSDLDPTLLPHVGALDRSQTAAFHLRLSVPPDAAPNLYSFYVSARGALSGAEDAVRIDVQTGEILPGALRLSPDGAASVGLCGMAGYTHRLAHNGVGPLTARLRLVSQSAFSSALDWPTGPLGAEPRQFAPAPDLTPGALVAIFDGAAKIWTTRALVSDGAGGVALPLSPGDWTQIRLRVFAPCSAAVGTQDVAILAAESLDGQHVSRVQDVTTTASVALSIEKAGAPDADCLNGPDSPFVTGGVTAPPGGCVIWRLTAWNLGAETVCDVRLTDDAPEFTILQGSPYIVPTPPPNAGSCTVSGSNIACLVGPQIDIDGDGILESHCLRPGERAEARFSVRIE